MSPKEARKLEILERAVSGECTVGQAAMVLNLSERQVKRLKKRFRAFGPAALAHGNRGRTSRRAAPAAVRRKVVELYMGALRGASHCQVSEILFDQEGIALSPKTISRILRATGIANPHAHKGPRRRRSRDRMPQEGMLVQIDASPHAWLEDRGPKMNLHGAIDDATSRILALSFRPTEDIRGYQELFRSIIRTHGVPRAFYSDRHSMFVSPKADKLSVDDELAGHKAPLTQIGAMLDSLGIAHVRASSPQAKGRVERLWRTLHSRLMIELRLASTSSLEEANAFLPGFIEHYNGRFARLPASPISAFRPAPPPDTLDLALSLREARTATNGSTIHYHGRDYRLVDRNGRVALLKPRARVLVHTLMDGSLSATYDQQRYSLRAIAPAVKAVKEAGHLARKARTPVRGVPIRLGPRTTDPIDAYFRRKNLYWARVFAQR